MEPDAAPTEKCVRSQGRIACQSLPAAANLLRLSGRVCILPVLAFLYRDDGSSLAADPAKREGLDRSVCVIRQEEKHQ